MSDSNTSTLQSYMDSATGAAQSALGSVTGNKMHQVLEQMLRNDDSLS